MILRVSGGPSKDCPHPQPYGENLEGFRCEGPCAPNGFVSDWEGEMLTKGCGAGGVGIKPGLRSVMLHGDPPEASSEGVPLFLQREELFPTKQWKHTCELQPVKPGSWACNLVLGPSPEVSSQS